jgi:AraC-like DNA-binding protein
VDALLQPTAGIAALRQLPPLQTCDLDEARTRLSAVFRSHNLQFTRSGRALAVAHSGTACGRVSFHRLRYGGHVRMSAPEMGGFYLFQVALRGPFRILRNREATDVGERQAYAVNPHETFSKDWVPEGSQLIVRVERAALDECAQTLLGVGGERPIVFDQAVVDGARNALVAFAEYVHAFAGVPAALRRQLEETAIATVLASFPNSLSEELERPARSCAPYYVRRVEDAIDATPDAETSLADLTRIAGVSVRTLYYGFRRFRDTTPLAYLKAKRLDLAKARLLQADPAASSVTAIARGCGFTHPAKFAADFKARFGRAPSEVLRFKARGH